MFRPTLPTLLLALLLPAASPAPAGAQDEMLLIAFGDSITEGFGDDSPQGGGYPARLQRWLRQRGYDATVVNAGLGGETTGEGLSRVDGVLAGGGDFFLLMEGTNDISQRVGIETIVFNLDEMASRAESAGMTALHGTCIPRLPTAGADADNARTSALAASIVDLADVHGRLVADHFTLFESLPDLFDSYYYDGPEDPVGHPNGDGYQQMAGLWLETLLLLLETPQLQIVPPVPAASGALLSFGVETTGTFERLEWDFGDGGFAASESPPAELAQHIYLAPGTYRVAVTGETTAGGQASDAIDLLVGGNTVFWLQRQTSLPILLRGDGSLADDLVAGLAIVNPREDYALVDVAFVAEISYDTPPPARRLLLAPGTVTEVADALGQLYDLQRSRGAMVLTYRASPLTGGTAGLAASAALALAADGGAGDQVPELSSGQWSSVQKSIVGLTGGAATTLELAVANLDLGAGYVQLDLYDNSGALVDSALFELGPADVRLRRLTDLYRGLASRPQPFTAVFRAAGVRFTAAAVAIDPLGGSVTHYSSVP